MKNEWKLTFSLLLLVLVTVLIAFVISKQNKDLLLVVACDVGQGDAILIQKDNTQILVDGGLGSSVINCLDSYMPFWDRSIDAVILTHPQADHYEGLIEVVRRYHVEKFIATEFNNSTEGYDLLKKEVGVRNINIINPKPDNDIRIGLIYLDILFPTEQYDLDSNNVLGTNNDASDLNMYSVIFELKYKDFEMLFTGDIGPSNMAEILASGVDDTDVLKVPHHGSKNGLTESLLLQSEPEMAIISAGKKNRYGHPHREVIDMLRSSNVKILRTDEIGDVVIRTDGEKIWY